MLIGVAGHNICSDPGPPRHWNRQQITNLAGGLPNGVQRGDVITVDTGSALRYIGLGMAEAKLEGSIGRPYQVPSPDVMAALRAKIETAQPLFHRGKDDSPEARQARYEAARRGE
jgi:hypothetical protein